MNCILFLLAIAISLAAIAADRPPRGNNRPQSAIEQTAPAVPATPLSIVLGRPTQNGVTTSLLATSDQEGVIEYGDASGPLQQTALQRLPANTPVEIRLQNLQPDREYRYRLLTRQAGGSLNGVAGGRFRTQRPAGGGFTFTVTADSHLDPNTDPALYQRTLANALADAPDFHIDLGDTFMTGKHASHENAAQQYLAQRAYLGELASSAPLFLVLGNHDGEEARLLRDGKDSLAVWSNTMRKRYFPNPLPDAFYSGNAVADPQAGMLQDYYAWTWGDALFVVLDPYWHGANRRGDERWELSLGDVQYRWLKQTLETSRARFKIVLVHQLIGGLDRQGRGGIEGAMYGEWGGKNADGSDGFAAHRPGWELPIHALLVRNRVNLVLHGHDHLYAKQELDGIVYQEVPQPGHPGQGDARSAAEYGYRTGTILGSSGHLRFSVSASGIKAEYIGAENRQVRHAYTMTPAKP